MSFNLWCSVEFPVTGLTDVRYTLIKSDGTVTQAWTHTGVVDRTPSGATRGTYGVTASIPDGWEGDIHWEDDGTTPTRFASAGIGPNDAPLFAIPGRTLAVAADGSVTAGNEEPIAGDVLLTQASEDDSHVVIGHGTPGATITAYLSTDTSRATPLRQCTVEVDGDWSLGVAPGATYTLAETLDGYSETTRTVTA